jgi:hypothetical protein
MKNFVDRIKAQIKKHPEPSRDVDHYTAGDFIRAVPEIHDEEEARMFRDGYFDSLVRLGKSDEEAKRLCTSNLGWCMGEGMSKEDIEMWDRVGASHPVFGSMLGGGPTSKVAFNAGVQAGKQARKLGITVDRLTGPGTKTL